MTPDDRKRAIGKVISVTADRFIIELHSGTDNFTIVGFDDIHYVARLGSFLIIPVQSEYVVSEIVGLREKDSAGGKEGSGSVLDKASSAKFLDVVPVGMLPQNGQEKFRFGVSTFPSLYADALYAVDEELDRIFDVDQAEEPIPRPSVGPGSPPGTTRYRAITVGQSVVFQGYEVKVRLDEFFGGHSAVLGNTGSGKSCTVASILQSLFEKTTNFKACGATFVTFDVNGEYYAAFGELNVAGEIQVDELILDGTREVNKFQLPHWFLEQSEWEMLLQASEKTQIPVLRNALGLTSMLNGRSDDRIKAHFIATCVIQCMQGADGDSPVSKFQRVHSLLSKYPTPNLDVQTFNKFNPSMQYGNFAGNNQHAFIQHVTSFVKDDIHFPAYTGQPFDFDDLLECLDFAILYEEAHGNRQIRDYCASMITRLHSLSDREEFNFLKVSVKNAPSLEDFMKKVLGIRSLSNSKSQSQIIIINMNAVDDEVVELVSAVIARMVFKAMRKADPRNSFPVHFVLEEAHRYIADKPSRYSIEASKIFERIAKEGRKYGVFLLVASQRPSELSRTVLSQCSNFVVHRIQNPEDLAHIRQMTPFISDAVLKRLPSLPKQHALVFGNAVNLPTTFRVRQAHPLPLSHDTRIRDLWFRSPKKYKRLPSDDEL